MRFRDDKPAGNYKTVVENIIKSIADGVEKEQVVHSSIHVKCEHFTELAPSFSHDLRPSAMLGKHATPTRNNVQMGRLHLQLPGHRRNQITSPANRPTGTHHDDPAGQRPGRVMGLSRSRRGAKSPVRRWSLGCTGDGRRAGGPRRRPCVRRSRLTGIRHIARTGPRHSTRASARTVSEVATLRGSGPAGARRDADKGVAECVLMTEWRPRGGR